MSAPTENEPAGEVPEQEPSSPAVEIRFGSEADDVERDAFVHAHPRGTLFHDSRWRRVVNRVFGHLGREVIARRDGRIVGVLPMMRVSALPSGANLVSMPYAVYGGPLGEDLAIEQALVDQAVAEARQLGVGRLELRSREPLGEVLGATEQARARFQGSTLYHTFIRDLPEDPAEVLQRMPKKARAEARKARNRHKLELVEGRWYVDDLYRMFVENKRQLGSPALPADLFRQLLSFFGNDAYVHLVRRGRDPKAAVMSFAFEDTLVAYYSGTLPGADREVSASNFMYMALQEWACERGFTKFDFCRSRGDSGAFQFKVHQGFEPAPLDYQYLCVRKQGLPGLTPSNPRTKILRDVWSKLPRGAVEMLSPAISRYLS